MSIAKAKTDPKNTFLTAEEFRESAKILFEAKNDGRLKLSVSIATNSAFALEMYLKCLVLLETGVRSGVRHNLHQLFRSLNPITQTELTATHEESLRRRGKLLERLAQRGKPSDLESLLKAGKDAFIEFRYLSENIPRKVPTTSTWALNAFMACVRDRIAALHPHWKLYD